MAATALNETTLKMTYETALGATPNKDIRGGPTTLYLLHVDNNQSGSTTAVYLKLYDKAIPVVGTDAPTFIFLIPASTVVCIPLNLPSGVLFATALSMACMKEAGTAGTTAPDTNVIVTAYTNS